jgi:hypothetical protein
LLAHGAFGAARTSIDASEAKGIVSIGGIVGKKKEKSDIMKDLAAEIVGIGSGKAVGTVMDFAKIDLPQFVFRGLSNSGKPFTGHVITRAFLGELANESVKSWFGVMFDGLIKREDQHNPFYRWGEKLDTRHKTLSEVVITAKKLEGQVHGDPESVKKAQEQIENEGQKHRNKNE